MKNSMQSATFAPMNAPFPTPSQLERHRFTIDDVLKMTAQGLIDKRTELLDGEIYDMPSDGDAHIEFTMRLAQQAMATLLGKPYFVGVQTTLRLSTHNAPSPDIYVLAGGAPKGEIPSDRILLVIEVADTSLADDLKDSASRYARHGVRDYWVVDVNARAIHVHRDPKGGAYPPPRKLNASETVAALLIPGLTVTLDSLPGPD